MDGLIFIWVCSDCRRIRFVFQIGSERWTVGTVIYKWLYLICVSRHHHPIAINNEGVSHAICCVSVWLSNKKAWGRTSVVSLSKQSCWQNISAWLSTDCCSLCHHHFTALLVTAWILLSSSTSVNLDLTLLCIALPVTQKTIWNLSSQSSRTETLL